jgi:uncharacterized protein YndB with AHSA1/START domain
MSTRTDLTVRKSVTVGCSPDEAFTLFTEHIATWWPLETHSPAEETPESVVFEPRVGGRVYDRRTGGEESEWATVTVWEPPSRLAVDWHVTPGHPSTELEVRFTAEGGGTRVDLTHGGWERYGEKARETFDSYDAGWDTVLRPYIDRAGV